ncbi:MAG: 23S rRNA (adenine(2503)-C(2))-methyltransferase RlmN [Bacilli bacterium]|nr:23S rRNA (adenine(2503)-C(2))-methyltransferase RlmN [Bacilli bacterium]
MSKSREQLELYFLSINEKKFKALQVYEWLYQKKEFNVDDWSNIKKDIREKIKEDYSLDFIKIVKKEEDNLTKKYLFELSDSEFVEAVLMEHDYGLSICVSSQVGCNMGCAFCESGRLKKIRNLETYEMVEQILLIEQDINKRISSVVVMGIGEPFDNYDNVMNFITIINNSKGLAIGARHITVSTCGLVPKIYEFAKFPLQVNLAISLHASNNELRNKLMNVNKVYSLDKLLTAIKDYIAQTNRRVTIEYVMLNLVNDNIENAIELSNLLKGLNVYVNLIPYNETNHIEFKKSSKNRIMQFYDTLKKNNINVTIRKEFGSNISAACGQLRSKEVR